MRLFFLLLLASTLLLSDTLKGVWLELKSGEIRNLSTKEFSEKEFIGNDLVATKEGGKSRLYKKLNYGNSSLEIEVFGFQDSKPYPLKEPKVEVTARDDERYFEPERDEKGIFLLQDLTPGEYFIKITDANSSFFGAVALRSGENRRAFYLSKRENFYLKRSGFDLFMDTLEKSIPLEISNPSLYSAELCLDIDYSDRDIANYRVANRCFYLGARKSITTPVVLLFSTLDSTKKELPLTLKLKSGKRVWKTELALRLFYDTERVKLTSKEEVRGYIVSPENRVEPLEREAEVLSREGFGYRVLLYAENERATSVLESTKSLSAKEPLFSMTRSIVTGYGKVEEFFFETKEDIILNEESKTFVKALFEDAKEVKISNPKLADVYIKNSKLYITPKKDMSGSAVIEVAGEGRKTDYYLQVKEVNDPPVIIFEPDTLIRKGEEYRYSFKVIDPDSDSLEKKVKIKPSWLRYDREKEELRGIARRGDNYVLLEVSDEEAKVVKSFYIDVVDNN